jgi:hypothetical protein
MHHYRDSRSGLALAGLLAVLLLAWPAHGGEGPGGISGTWWASEYHPKIQPIGGGELPFTDKGKAAYAKNVAGLKDGSISDTARKICAPDGVPRILATPYPFEIVQSPPNQIAIVNELNHEIRLVPLDKSMPSEEELESSPFYNGHSVGHWDGNTLVIDTAGFNEKTFLDASGAPHTDQMRTEERIRRIAPNEIEDVVTVHDPDYYSKDWSARFTYRLRNDLRLDDYVCGETHRNLSSVKGVGGR